MSELYLQLSQRVIISRVQDLMRPKGNWYVDAITEKITAEPPIAVNHNTTWAHIHTSKKNPDSTCTYNKLVLWERFGLHPSFCKTICHKVVVHPKTLKDLFTLHDIFTKEELESKVGTELRKRVPHLYGGYCYCYSMDQGQAVKAFVQKRIDKHFKEPVGAQLKIGCTEMEEHFGRSTTWPEVTDIQRENEKHIASFFDLPVMVTDFPEFVKWDIMLEWFNVAWKHQDPTVNELNRGRPLYTSEIDYY